MMHYLPAPIHDGKSWTSSDCSLCGRPTLIARHYGEPPGDVVLDAMPLSGLRIPLTFYGEYAQTMDRDKPIYQEHICPLREINV